MSELACNRCGECCKAGGACEMRRLSIWPMVPIAFVGRCDFLADNPDGTTTCEMMAKQDQSAEWFRRLVSGSCNVVELRREILLSDGK